MSQQDFTLPMHYVRQIADLLRTLGMDVPAWLAKSGLSEPDLLDAQRAASFDVAYRLIVDALSCSGERALGLLVGERLVVNTHGILGYAAMNSGTLRQALDLFERYIGVRTTLVAVSHEVQGAEVRVQFQEPIPLGDIQRTVLEAIVLTVKNVLDYITMGSRHVQWVAFPFAQPDYAELAADMFGCDVRYGQTWAGFTIPAGVLDQPLTMADAATFAQAAAICERELDKVQQNASLANKVRRIMLEKQNGFPSLQVTARLFHLTPRTLHRRLQEEGTSYKEILESVRHKLAVAHLKAGHLSVQEIAYTLGYTDMANFRRAFKRWEGVAPSDYRQK